MKIEKRGNSYRARQMYKGKVVRVSFDHKPTQKEITLALADKISEITEDSLPGSVKSYAEKYLDLLRKDGRSTTTILGYKSCITNTPEWFLKTELSSITSKTLQKLVDEYQEGRSPKTVSNLYGFYRAILTEFRPDSVFSIKLPKKEKKPEYEPSTQDIKAILKASEGTRFKLFLRLSSIGLRRGEIAALTSADLSDDNILTINKDMVKGEDKKYYIKDCPKTSASNRRILIPKDIADMLREKGKAYDGDIHYVNKYLHTLQDKLGIPRFRLHIMRHFAAAYLVKQGFTKEQILEYCGWEKGSTVMERVYSYNLDPEDSQKDIAKTFGDLF